MTTQHVPHTPLWRKFLSLPHTRLGRWAVGLSAVSVALFLWAFLFLGGPVPNWHTWVAPWLSWAVPAFAVILAIMLLVVPLASGVVGSLALGAGEGSLLVWFAQVPAALFCAGLLNIFQEPSPWGWVRAAVGVLIWAVIAFNIWNSTRLGRKRS